MGRSQTSRDEDIRPNEVVNLVAEEQYEQMQEMWQNAPDTSPQSSTSRPNDVNICGAGSPQIQN
jgi:hypothetical protein